MMSRSTCVHPKKWPLYLEACLEEAKGDAAFIAKALGDIARARGMTQVARDARLSRESLYKALSGERSPDFDTILPKSGKRAGFKIARRSELGPSGDSIVLRVLKCFRRCRRKGERR